MKYDENMIIRTVWVRENENINDLIRMFLFMIKDVAHISNIRVCKNRMAVEFQYSLREFKTSNHREVTYGKK